jgi:hypothetical protein
LIDCVLPEWPGLPPSVLVAVVRLITITDGGLIEPRHGVGTESNLVQPLQQVTARRKSPEYSEQLQLVAFPKESARASGRERYSRRAKGPKPIHRSIWRELSSADGFFLLGFHSGFCQLDFAEEKRNLDRGGFGSI